MKKLTITVVALATLAATPVLAQTYQRARTSTAPMATAPTMSGGSGFGAYAAVPTDSLNSGAVFSYGRYAGQDPDPAIRLMLKRDAIGTESQ